MKINEIQKFCNELLSRVKYPRLGTIIGFQEEVGKLAGVIMDIEIYEKNIDKTLLEEKCSEVFFSLIDLCNSYNVDLDTVSGNRIVKINTNIEKWEKDHGETLKDKRKKLD